MPARLLNSSVLKWPDLEAVDQAVRSWTRQACKEKAGILLVGYIGSYARGDWGVGSDVDLVLVVKRSSLPFEERSSKWDLTCLPVPADLLVYTMDEWESFADRDRFLSTVKHEAVWTYMSPSALELTRRT